MEPLLRVPDKHASNGSNHNHNNDPSSSKMVDIEEPHSNDVLCGRGVTTNKWIGNEQFRSLVGLNKELYVTSTKRQKMAISRSIVEAVRSMNPPGRFLEKNAQTGLWSDIGDRKATEKTSQALRDGAATLRKQLSEDLGDPDFIGAVFELDSSTGSNHSSSNNKEKEKTRAIKAKPSVKKGHRRIMSNPDGYTAAKKTSLTKKLMKSTEQPVSPQTQSPWKSRTSRSREGSPAAERNVVSAYHGSPFPAEAPPLYGPYYPTNGYNQSFLDFYREGSPPSCGPYEYGEPYPRYPIWNDSPPKGHRRHSSCNQPLPHSPYVGQHHPLMLPNFSTASLPPRPPRSPTPPSSTPPQSSGGRNVLMWNQQQQQQTPPSPNTSVTMSPNINGPRRGPSTSRTNSGSGALMVPGLPPCPTSSPGGHYSVTTMATMRIPSSRSNPTPPASPRDFTPPISPLPERSFRQQQQHRHDVVVLSASANTSIMPKSSNSHEPLRESPTTANLDSRGNDGHGGDLRPTSTTVMKESPPPPLPSNHNHNNNNNNAAGALQERSESPLEAENIFFSSDELMGSAGVDPVFRDDGGKQKLEVDDNDDDGNSCSTPLSYDDDDDDDDDLMADIADDLMQMPIAAMGPHDDNSQLLPLL